MLIDSRSYLSDRLHIPFFRLFPLKFLLFKYKLHFTKSLHTFSFLCFCSLRYCFTKYTSCCCCHMTLLILTDVCNLCGRSFTSQCFAFCNKTMSFIKAFAKRPQILFLSLFFFRFCADYGCRFQI